MLIETECGLITVKIEENLSSETSEKLRRYPSVMSVFLLLLLLLKYLWLTLCKSENMTPSPSVLGFRICHLLMTLYTVANETSVTLKIFSQVS